MKICAHFSKNDPEVLRAP